MAADSSPVSDNVSGIASAAIAFGLGVCRKTGGEATDRPPAVGLPAASTDISDLFIGVALFDATQPADPTPIGYAQYDVLAIKRVGRVWVTCQDGCAVGDPVFCRFQGGNEGVFRTDADTANAAQVPNASWRSIAAAGELAAIELKGTIQTA